MARRTGGGNSSGYQMALMVIFAILFVFAAATCVLFFTKMDKERQVMATKEQEQNKIITKEELAAVKARGGLPVGDGQKLPSLYEQLSSENARLKQIIIAKETATLDEVRLNLSNASIPADETLVALVRKLRADAAYAVEMQQKSEIAAKAAAEAARAADAEKASLAAAYSKSVDELGQKLARIDEANKSYQGTVDAARKELEGQLEAVRNSTSGQIRELQTQVEQKDRQTADLRKRLDSITADDKRGGGRGGSAGPQVDPSTLPDGQVVALIQEENLAYISRGRSNRVVAGMTFEVFDKNAGISKNEVNDLRGKATLEVLSVDADTSLARIVRISRGQTVLEGDLIANAVYDPNLKFKFRVFGEFDIDSIGQATEGDRRRIETMVGQWGGVIVNDLNYDTDFLVLGVAPSLPPALSPDEIDPEKLVANAAAVKKFEDYNKLEGQAKTLQVPILNQNRFLILTGYYRR